MSLNRSSARGFRAALPAAGLALSLAVAPSAVAQQHTLCTPSLDISGRPCFGQQLSFEMCADPGCFVSMLMSTEPGPLQLGNLRLPIGFPFFYTIAAVIPPGGGCAGITLTLPTLPDLVGTEFYYFGFGLDLRGSIENLAPGPSGVFTFCGCDPRPVETDCFVIIDEDTIDNGFSQIQRAAVSHGVTPDWLVNDDRPTEVGNPWLRWNERFPGDIVILPGGRVDDEGLFALPRNLPWSLADYVAGLVPQNQLDRIPEVMPLRNHELAKMRGRECVAVVYDSDISMNYLPILGNLQGARYGLFAFRVLEVINPGTIPESTSSTSLYDLVVEVLSPSTVIGSFGAEVHDHEPDVAEIVRARQSGGFLKVVAESDFSSASYMTCTVDGFTFESPMTYNPSNGRFELSLAAPNALVGRRVCVQSDHGGAYNGFVTN